MAKFAIKAATIATGMAVIKVSTKPDTMAASQSSGVSLHMNTMLQKAHSTQMIRDATAWP